MPKSASRIHRNTTKVVPLELTDRDRSVIESVRSAMARFLRANYGPEGARSLATHIGMTPGDIYHLMIAETLVGSPPLFANVAHCAGADWRGHHAELAGIGKVKTIGLSEAKVIREFFMLERGWRFEDLLPYPFKLLYRLARNVDPLTVLTVSPRVVAKGLSDDDLRRKLQTAIGIDDRRALDAWLLENGFQSDRILDVFQRLGVSMTMTEILFFEETIRRFAVSHSLAGASDVAGPRRLGNAIVALCELLMGKRVDYERGYIPIANPELYDEMAKLASVQQSKVDSGFRPLHNSQYKPSKEALERAVRAGTKVKLSPSGATSRFLRDLEEDNQLGSPNPEPSGHKTVRRGEANPPPSLLVEGDDL